MILIDNILFRTSFSQAEQGIKTSFSGFHKGCNMITKQLTGAHIIRFISIIFMVLGLTACSSTPEPQPAPEPEPAPVVEAEPAAPEPTVIKPDYPDRYTVKRGDTLWDIAGRFLKDPWLWPEVWHINPAVRNPHLIYPGDVIVLYYVDGKPFLTMEGAPGMAPKYKKPGIKSYKLSPKIRSESLEKAITTIPRELIAPFLSRPRIATEDQIEDAPYVISSFEEHMISGSSSRIYVKGIKGDLGAYHVVRPGEEYKDPETGETLGYELIDLADARVTRSGEPTTLIINNAKQEVFNGDILFPHESKELDFQFFPRAPDKDIRGSIVSVVNGVSLIGQYNIVVLNRGAKHGLEPGHVLAVYQKGADVRDPKAFWSWSTIKMPDERAAILMVFRVDEKVSYGLIMEAQRTIRIHDYVMNP